MGYYGYGMGAFGWIGMVLVWAVLILLIAWLWRALDLGRPPQGSSSRALDIAKERYARGEIDAGEFERLKRELA